MKKVLDIQEIQNKSEGVDKQFKELLDCLQEMPCDTPEARKQRFSWMKGRPEYDEFINKLMKEWNEGRQDKLRITPPTEREISVAFHADTGIATTQKYGKEKDGKKQETDPVVFFETVIQTIENYTGINNQGKSYTFIQSLGARYRQNVMIAAGINDFQKNEPNIDIRLEKDKNAPSEGGIDGKRLYKILKLVRGVDRLIHQLQATYGNIDIQIDEVIEKWILEDKKKRDKKKQEKEKPPYTKKELQLAKYLIERLPVVSIDDKISEDGNATYGDYLEYSEEDTINLEDMQSFFEFIQKDFDIKWKLVMVATQKRDQEVIKAFLARDILIALKLKVVNETQRKTYKDLLEPKCASWCPKYTCPHVKQKDGKIETSRESCFIRYGDISIENRGDQRLYALLEQMGNSFYQIILHNEYVRRAYINEVKNYYDLFAEELKPAKGADESETFEFTDIVLAKALRKSENNVSKYKKAYKEKTKPTLYRLFREELE